MNTVTTIRELGPEEISLVGGAWTWEELIASMFAGAVIGAITAGLPTAGVGIIPGATSGALLAGMSYLVKDYIEYVLEYYWA
jgi:hypothetical protein